MRELKVIWSEDEVDAAMCLWEYCITCQALDDESVFDWLRGGEGAAAARRQCVLLAEDCDTSYKTAAELGYDVSFDWDFVPAWVQMAMDLSSEHDLTAAWIDFIGRSIYREFRLEH